MQTVSITRTPSSRATIAAGTSPPRVIAITAWNGPTSFSRQVSARQSRWNWSHETGKALPARSAALSSGGSAIIVLLHLPDHGGRRRSRHDLVVLKQFAAELAHFPAAQYHTSHAFQRTDFRRPVKLHVEINRRCELAGVQRRRQGRSHGVVQHRREKAALHVAGRVQKLRLRLEL